MNEKSTSQTCDTKELKRRLEDGKCVLLDVREYAEFSGGRVAGAKLIPLGDVERRYTEIDRGSPVYVMCRSGKRGGEAAEKANGSRFF